MGTNTLNMFDLSGRVALVTGASKGMGRSIAAIFAKAGARVAISSRNQVECDQVAAEISQEKGQCLGIASDAGSTDSLAALAAKTQERIGHPTILVCNAAGEAPIGVIEKIELSDFDVAMAANVRNNLFLARLVSLK